MKFPVGSVKRSLFLITYTVILLALALNFHSLMEKWAMFYSACSPLICGLVIAFVLNQPLRFLERKLFHTNNYTGFQWKLRRAASLILSLLLALTLLSLVVLVIAPQVVSSGRQVLAVLSVSNSTLLDELKELLPFLNWESSTWSFLESFQSNIRDSVYTLLANNTKGLFDSALGMTTSVATHVITSFTKFLIGLFGAIYVLACKERLGKFFSGLLASIFPPRILQRIFTLLHLTSLTFSNFIVGQLLESCILSVLCFIGMSIFHFPYAPVISVLVGSAAIIPIIGAWIGGALAAVLIAIINPLKALEFIVFLLILQQIEGNLIYPKVVGKSVGIPGILVFAAVILGTNLGGIAGVFLSVPLSAVAYVILCHFIEKRQEKAPLQAKPDDKT